MAVRARRRPGNPSVPDPCGACPTPAPRDTLALNIPQAGHPPSGTRTDHVAARKKKRKPGRGKTDIHRGPTRDPGPTGNVGCYFIFFSMLAIGLIVLLLEIFT